MSQSAEAKLQELRSKTNRQLISLICNRLDHGLAMARELSMEQFPNAEQAYADAKSWMDLLDGASLLDVRRLEFKLAQLRSALDGVRATGMRVHAAC